MSTRHLLTNIVILQIAPILCSCVVASHLFLSGCSKGPSAAPRLTRSAEPGLAADPVAPAVPLDQCEWLPEEVEAISLFRVTQLFDSPLSRSFAERIANDGVATIAKYGIKLGDVATITTGWTDVSRSLLETDEILNTTKKIRSPLMIIKLRPDVDFKGPEGELTWEQNEFNGMAIFVREPTGGERESMSLLHYATDLLLAGPHDVVKDIARRGPSKRVAEKFSGVDARGDIVLAFAPTDQSLPARLNSHESEREELTNAISLLHELSEMFVIQLMVENEITGQCRSLCRSREAAEKLSSAYVEVIQEIQTNRDDILTDCGVLAPLISVLVDGVRLCQINQTAELCLQLTPEQSEQSLAFLLALFNGLGQPELQSKSARRALTRFSDTNAVRASRGRPEDFELRALPVWKDSYAAYSEEITFPPSLQCDLMVKSSAERPIIAYRKLKIDAAGSESGRLRWVRFDSQRGEFWQSLEDQQTEMSKTQTLIEIPIQFLFPLDEKLEQFGLNGSVELLTATSTSSCQIKDLDELTWRGNRQLEIQGVAIEVYTFSPRFEGDYESLTIVFPQEIFLSDLSMVDEAGVRLGSQWAEHRPLPDGRSSICIRGIDTPIRGDVILEFLMHRDVTQHVCEFEFAKLSVPVLARPIGDMQKQIIRWTPAEENPNQPDRVHIEAKAVWNDQFFLSDATNRGFEPIQLVVNVTGPAVNSPVAIGNVSMESCNVDGESLSLLHGEDQCLDQMLSGFVRQNEIILPGTDGVVNAGVPFAFMLPRSDVKQVDHFAGQLTVINADSRQSFVVADVLTSLGQPIESDLLKEYGIELIPKRSGAGLEIKVESGEPLQVERILPLDMSGHVSSVVYSGVQSFNGTTVFSLHGDQQLPVKLPLRIIVNTQISRHTMPFRFQRIPIPPKPRRGRSH